MHQYKTRVRYSEIDKMGIVYHSRYIEWFEAARTEMLRDRGLPYQQLEEQGILLPVIQVYCEYYKPVYYDELITIQTNVKDINRLKLHLDYKVFGDSSIHLRAEGYSIHCFTNPQGKPIRAQLGLVNFIGKSAQNE